MDKIPCTACTFLNSPTSKLCLICGESLRSVPDVVIIEDQFETDDKWSCSACTYFNSISSKTCEVCSEPNPISSFVKKVKRHEPNQSSKICPFPECGAEVPIEIFDEHTSLHQINQRENETEEWHKLRRRYGFEARGGTGTYAEQYEKSLQNSLNKQKITEEELGNWQETLKNKLNGPETSKRSGLIQMIRDCYKPPCTYHICGITDHFCSDRGDLGWGCGYRNIQMLSSYLIRIWDYKKLLYGGLEYVPSIPVIQDFIEKAWAKGFDIQGASQLGNGLKDTKKMIGATECAALLRSFGVNAKVVDFYSARKPNVVQTILTPVNIVENGNVVKKKKKAESPYKPNKALVKWVWDYFSTKSFEKEMKAPLYLQHEGHSRTIIGIEKRGQQMSLLIFDPSHFSSDIFKDLCVKKIK